MQLPLNNVFSCAFICNIHFSIHNIFHKNVYCVWVLITCFYQISKNMLNLWNYDFIQTFTAILKGDDAIILPGRWVSKTPNVSLRPHSWDIVDSDYTLASPAAHNLRPVKADASVKRVCFWNMVRLKVMLTIAKSPVIDTRSSWRDEDLTLLVLSSTKRFLWQVNWRL